MALVVEYHEELEMDLHAQRVDLLDFWRGTLSPRRLELLIRHMPAGSAFIGAVSPEASAAASWTPGDYLNADLYDITARVHFKNPKPYPRPVQVVRNRMEREARAAALEEQAERNRRRLS